MIRPAKCKAKGCDIPWIWRHEDGSKLCEKHHREELRAIADERADVRDDWGRDDLAELEREHAEGPGASW